MTLAAANRFSDSVCARVCAHVLICVREHVVRAEHPWVPLLSDPHSPLDFRRSMKQMVPSVVRVRIPVCLRARAGIFATPHILSASSTDISPA